VSAPSPGRSFTARGRVQGVGFRWFVRETATTLGLGGWVANQSDGSVQGEVWGDPDSLKTFLSALAKGPPGASVTTVDGAEIEVRPVNTFTFEIRK
jgi:acylphosphatase